MERFKRILFLTDATMDDEPAMARALDLVRRNGGTLSVLVLHAELPEALSAHQAAFSDFLEQRLRDCVEGALARLNWQTSPDAFGLRIEARSGPAPEVTAIREVLRDEHDLVMKTAHPVDAGRGFMALDMGLLRKSPVPVWLWRPATGGEGPVAVAIDPLDEGRAARQLSLRLLDVADDLALMLDRPLVVLSCWDFAMEDYLRHHVFAGATETELNEIVMDEKRRHRAALEALIGEAAPQRQPSVLHLRGRPEEIIPEQVGLEGIDTLVMGTLARTGIPGFIIGNTAENLLQRLSCSLLAMKPAGFVSPIKPS